MSMSGVFPVEIDLEGPPNDDDEDSGYVPTPEHEREEAMPSDLGERKEVIPQEPESDFSEDFEEPQLLGSLLRQHEARGHWPYDKGCDSCVQARGGDDSKSCTYFNGSRLYICCWQVLENSCYPDDPHWYDWNGSHHWRS